MRYIPGFIGQKYKDNVFNGRFGGFALLFDLADFTPITTLFNKHGKKGAGELRNFLDFIFGETIRIVESYGGFVTLFAGDAFCAVFPDEVEEVYSLQKDRNEESGEKTDSCNNNKEIRNKDRILNAVLKISRFFKDKEIYQSALGDIKLKIRQTVTYGEINWRVFRNDLQNEYVFYGKPLKDLAGLSSLKKDLVFSKDAAEHIGIESFKKIKKDGYIYIKEIEISEPEYSEKPYREYTTAFINKKYQNVSPQPEIRSAAICFANLSKIDFKDREEAIGHIQILADRYGGYVSSYDATDKGMVSLILFGMPISEERILERICRFALGIIVKVPQLAIGLSKGNVYAGYTGSGDIKEYAALGTAVNLAARLMGKAEPGEIITDSNFYRELMDKFRFEEIGPIKLKGIKNPIISYRLDKQLIERRVSRETNFTGRGKLLVELKQTLNEALSKKKNLSIYVYGNAGIGKSRLCDELMDKFPDKSFNRFFLYCDSVIQRSFEPVKQIIRQYFPADPENDRKERISDFRTRWKILAGKDDELIRIESIIASIIGYEWEKSIWSILPSPEKPKQQKNAFLRFMAEMAKKKPVIIYLDDGQWIDEESKEYFQAMSKADIEQIQIICSCRYFDDGRKPNLELENHIKVEKDLDILDEESSEEMVRHVLKLQVLPKETFTEINSRAMGNPFFIEQLCAYLKEIGKIDSAGRIKEDLGPIASFQISDIIGSRIDRLTTNVRECVYNASVLGMEFNVNILSEMLKRPLKSDLESGKSNMIWKDLKELQYIFNHIMIKDTAYTRIIYNKLKTLHKLGAEAMEIIHKDSIDEHAQEIALHYEKADIPDKGAFYYDKAGIWLTYKYNFIKGELCLKKALEMKKKVLGTDHPDIAISLNNLANLYWKQGKYSEAEPLYNHALKIREKVLEKDHPDVATYLNNLALLYDEQGKYSESEPFYTRSLEIREKALGKDHPDVATSLNNLACLYSAQGKYSESESLYIRSLEIREKALGKDHPDVATSLKNLAALYFTQGKYKEAELLYTRSLEIEEKALGKDHPNVAESLNGLALLFWQQGKYKEAEPIHTRSLEIREKALGKDHPDVAQSLKNLAALYFTQGKYSEAELLYTRSLEIEEKALGKDHPEVAKSLHNLAALYFTQGKYEEAKPLYTRSLEIKEKALGKDHPLVAGSLNNLAILNCEQGKYVEAEPFFTRSLEISEKALGKDHPEVAGSLNNLATLYHAQGKYSEAGSLFARSLEIRKNALGKDHPDVAESMNGLANLYKDQEKYIEAEPLFKRALQIAETALGNQHETTEKYRKDLKDCQESMRKKDK